MAYECGAVGGGQRDGQERDATCGSMAKHVVDELQPFWCRVFNRPTAQDQGAARRDNSPKASPTQAAGIPEEFDDRGPAVWRVLGENRSDFFHRGSMSGRLATKVRVAPASAGLSKLPGILIGLANELFLPVGVYKMGYI